MAINVHTGDVLFDGQNSFNACTSPECKAKINTIITKLQEVYRAQQAAQQKVKEIK